MEFDRMTVNKSLKDIERDMRDKDYDYQGMEGYSAGMHIYKWKKGEKEIKVITDGNGKVCRIYGEY